MSEADRKRRLKLFKVWHRARRGKEETTSTSRPVVVARTPTRKHVPSRVQRAASEALEALKRRQAETEE